LTHGVQQDVDLPRQSRDAPRDRRQEPHRRRPHGQRHHQRRECERAAEQRVVEHGHLDHHPTQALGRQRRRLERRVRAERGAEDDRLVDLQVIEQRDHLRPEGGHGVAPHVRRAVRAAVAEKVERDHAVAAIG
jgi:hypothetical protein